MKLVWIWQNPTLSFGEGLARRKVVTTTILIEEPEQVDQVQAAIVIDTARRQISDDCRHRLALLIAAITAASSISSSAGIPATPAKEEGSSLTTKTVSSDQAEQCLKAWASSMNTDSLLLLGSRQIQTTGTVDLLP